MTVHRPIVTTDGVTYATYELWWSEVERIATERHGPRETRYKKAPQPRSAFTTRNTWSDESALSEPASTGGPVVDAGSVRSGVSTALSPDRSVPDGPTTGSSSVGPSGEAPNSGGVRHSGAGGSAVLTDDATGRTNAQEEAEGREEARDQAAQETSDEETEGTDAGAITRDHTRDRDRTRDPEGTDHDDRARDGDDSRDREDRGIAPPSHTGEDAPPASDPHGAQTADRDDPADASS